MAELTGPVPTPSALRRPAPAAPSAPSPYGRVTDDGSVFLLAPEGEVLVGQYAAGTPAQGLAFFQRKYDDMAVEISLITSRLSDGKASVEQAGTVLARVREQLAARAFVGDVEALQASCDTLATLIDTERVSQQAAKAEQRAASIAARETLATEAESLANSTAWKATTERYAALVEEWKALPRADRPTEQELWKRISHSRTEFDKRRRAHFTDLDSTRKVALSRKRELIAQAETLSTSTDWAGTGRKLRDLLNDWKAAPRGSRADEDKLWKRFKAAQDSFYAAKTGAESAAEEVLKVNVPAKETLVAQAEKLMPITDVKSAKSALREIQDRWEKSGDIPRGDRDRLEKRLKRVEDAIRSAESDSWKRSNPEARSRAESTAHAFSGAIEKLQKQHGVAVAKGDTAAASKISDQIEGTKALLAAAERAASEFRG
ncbi:MAG: DUF349 domain-containing protein [Candidatus Nanopelagicales bacterium]